MTRLLALLAVALLAACQLPGAIVDGLEATAQALREQQDTLAELSRQLQDGTLTPAEYNERVLETVGATREAVEGAVERLVEAAQEPQELDLESIIAVSLATLVGGAGGGAVAGARAGAKNAQRRQTAGETLASIPFATHRDGAGS